MISPTITAITETGSRYDIDTRRGFWRKNEGGWEKLWSLQVGTDYTTPWTDPESWHDSPQPIVGQHLFVSAKDLWWRSTPVTDIIYHPDRIDDDSD